ncbi:MAG: ribbon-helix-helix domain-containing protein [Planctomycetales bacterium]
MSSRKSFLLRMDPALYQALERWAEQELRSVNGQIEFLLKRAVLARDRRALPEESRDEESAD